MADNDEAPIDPRYDPAFQRGFEGQVATGAHGQSTLRRTAAVTPAPPRPAPAVSVFAPAVAAPSEGAAPAAAIPLSGDAGVNVGSAAPSPASVGWAPVVGPRELLRNPFVIALIVLAAALVLTGIIWAYQGFSSIVKNGGTRNEVEFWAAQTMSFGAPLAIVVGLIVAGVLLALFGRSWQRSRE